MCRPRFEAIFRPFFVEQLIKFFTYEMLACYGNPYSFTELLIYIKYINIHK
jgi:hypothetical protein